MHAARVLCLTRCKQLQLQMKKAFSVPLAPGLVPARLAIAAKAVAAAYRQTPVP